MTVYDNDEDLLYYFGGESFLRKPKEEISSGTKCFYIYSSSEYTDYKYIKETIGILFGDYYMIKVKDEDTKIAVFPIKPGIIVSYKA